MLNATSQWSRLWHSNTTIEIWKDEEDELASTNAYFQVSLDLFH